MEWRGFKERGSLTLSTICTDTDETWCPKTLLNITSLSMNISYGSLLVGEVRTPRGSGETGKMNGWGQDPGVKG